MLNSFLPNQNKSQKFLKQSPSSSSYLNPQKALFQKTSQTVISQVQKDQLSSEQYKKLQSLLQLRESSLRQHAKYEYQLKLYIEDLQQKNKNLQKNNRQILNEYKSEVSNVKKQNEGLRKVIKRLQNENIDIKKQLQTALIIVNQQLGEGVNNNNNNQIQNIQRSQTVIKVIQSQDLKHSFRQSINFKLLPYNISRKQSPLLINNQYNRKNIHTQSKQKLQVTMKSSRQLDKPKSTTPGRNQNNIQYIQFQTKNQNHDRSIKKLLEFQKMNQINQQELKNKKVMIQRNSRIGQYKRTNPVSQDSQNQKNVVLGRQKRDKLIIKSLAKQFGEQYKKSNSKTLSIDDKKPLIKVKTKHQLIKLGHYGHPNIQPVTTR